MRKNDMRLSNDGFSLIEILVSIAIVSVILIPTIAAFSVYNQSAIGLKEIQRGTGVAENAMEVAKTGEFDEYKQSISFTNKLAGYSIEDSYESDYSNVGHKLAVSSNDGSGNNLASCYMDETGNIKFKKRADGNYCFIYEGVKDGKDSYDVVVKMSSSGYRTDAKDGYNNSSHSLGKIAGLDPKTTAVISTTSGIEQQAMEYFSSYTSNVKNDMILKLNIYVSGDDSYSNGSIILKAKPVYTLKSNQDVEFAPPGEIYSNTFEFAKGEKLEKIYILYNQSPGTVEDNSDQISFHFDEDSIIENTFPKIYIVRQDSATINENIIKNLDIVCENEDMAKECFEDGFLSDIRGNFGVQCLNASMGLQTRFIDRQGATSKRFYSTSSKFKQVPSDKIMLDTDEDEDPDVENPANNRIYDVVVTVYKANTGFSEVVTTLTSTRRE